MLAQYKVRDIAGIDVAAQPLTKSTLLLQIAPAGVLIDVDFPADATVVLTTAADTGKF